MRDELFAGMNPSWSIPTRYWISILLLAALAAVAWYIRELFEPLVIAGLVAYILNPVVIFLTYRTRMSHRLASNLVYFVVLALLIAIPATLAPVLLDEAQMLVSDLLQSLEQLRSALSQPFVIIGFRFNLRPFLFDLTQSLSNLLKPLPEDTLRFLERTSKGTAWFLVIVVSIYYFLTDWDKAREWLFRLAPPPYRADIRRLYKAITHVWTAYLRGQLTLMLIVGIVFTIVWAAIGLPGALILGLLTGLFSLVPEVGPFVGAMLAAMVALLNGSNYIAIPNHWFAVLVIGIYLVLINFKNIWLRPHVMGRSVHMHEGVVFVAIIAAVVFQGVLGALIVVPVLASAAVVLRYLRRRILGLPPFPEDGPPPVAPQPLAPSEAEGADSPDSK